MLPVIQVGPLSIQAEGLFYILGIWIAMSLAGRYAHLFKLQSEKLDTLVLIALAAGIVGARLTYLLRYPDIFMKTPLSVFSLNPTMLDLQGGILFGFLAGLVYSQRSQFTFWPTADALAPGLAVLQLAVGFANLFSGNAFGIPTALPWAISLWGEMRHPVQVYAIIGSLIILIVMVLWLNSVKKGKHDYLQTGNLFLSFIAGSSLMRILVDGFRGDSILIFESIRMSQVIAWLLLAFALWMLNKRQKPSPTKPVQ